MNKTVLFRDFEERDIGFIYKCKNDEKLNRLISGQYRHFSHEDAENWVRGCMGEHDTFKFWAVCTNDVKKNIIGWISVSNIDYDNQSACFHGIVIADPEYRDGMAWIESFLFVMEYIFEELHLNRMYGTALTENYQSIIIGEAMFEKTEGIFRQAIYKNDRFYDLAYCAILKDEYFYHKNCGDYEIPAIIRRIGKIRSKVVNK